MALEFLSDRLQDVGLLHSPKSRTHSIGTVDFAQLHTSHDQTRDDFASSLHDSIFRRVHVQATHPAEFLNLLHADKPLNAEGAKGTIVSGGGNDKWSIDRVWVHAALIIMVHSHQRPIGDHTRNTDSAVARASVALASDEVFNGSGVEKLDVREL